MVEERRHRSGRGCPQAVGRDDRSIKLPEPPRQAWCGITRRAPQWSGERGRMIGKGDGWGCGRRVSIPMTSLKQITANRRNALQSTGPRTEQGKDRSRRNALRHGLTAETVIEGFDDPNDYRAFENAIAAEYNPRHIFGAARPPPCIFVMQSTKRSRCCHSPAARRSPNRQTYQHNLVTAHANGITEIRKGLRSICVG